MNYWVCTDCGASNPSYESWCDRCGTIKGGVDKHGRRKKPLDRDAESLLEEAEKIREQIRKDEQARKRAQMEELARLAELEEARRKRNPGLSSKYQNGMYMVTITHPNLSV